jgi:hypothetical protein
MVESTAMTAPSATPCPVALVQVRLVREAHVVVVHIVPRCTLGVKSSNPKLNPETVIMAPLVAGALNLLTKVTIGASYENVAAFVPTLLLTSSEA